MDGGRSETGWEGRPSPGAGRPVAPPRVRGSSAGGLSRRAGAGRDDAAYDATAALLPRRPRPTAIFSTSNLTTIGVMRAIADQGFRCPKDVPVAGIDDFEWSTAFSPRLTTVVQPVKEIGLKAVACLLARLDGTSPAEPVRALFAPQLVVRDSCRVIG